MNLENMLNKMIKVGYEEDLIMGGYKQAEKPIQYISLLELIGDDEDE